MGTNYYLKGKPACKHCGREAEVGLHIGKSSGGWAFSLHIPTVYQCEDAGVPPIQTLDDWIPLFVVYGVINEYGDEVSSDEMIEIITKRSHPNGLQRHYDRRVGHGPTYDLITGEFS